MSRFFFCSRVSGVHIALSSFPSPISTDSAHTRTTSLASSPSAPSSILPQFSVPLANISHNTHAPPLPPPHHRSPTFHVSPFPHFPGRFILHSHQKNRFSRGNRLCARGKRSSVPHLKRPNYPSGFPVSPLSKSRGSWSWSTKQSVRVRSPRGRKATKRAAGRSSWRDWSRSARDRKSGPFPRHHRTTRSFCAGRFHWTMAWGVSK